MALYVDTIRDVLNNWDAIKLEIGEVPLHADDIGAILNSWDATEYDGSRDVRSWLMEIEEKYRIYGILEIQMTDVVAKCTDGEVKTVLTAMFEAKVAEAGVWA